MAARKLKAASAAQRIVAAVAAGEFSDAAAAVEAHPEWEAGVSVVEQAAKVLGTKPAPVATGSGPALLSR